MPDPGKPGDAVDKTPSAGGSLKKALKAPRSYMTKRICPEGKKVRRCQKDVRTVHQGISQESLASNSYFWIAETYYSEKKYEDAILAYEDF